jgi:hypothetical protein
MMNIGRRGLMIGTSAAVAGAAVKPFVSTAHAATPPAGKQNAGWYRYKVGDFEVTVVTDGAGANPLSDAYVSDSPKEAVSKDLEAQFLPKDKIIHT